MPCFDKRGVQGPENLTQKYLMVWPITWTGPDFIVSNNRDNPPLTFPAKGKKLLLGDIGAQIFKKRQKHIKWHFGPPIF